MSDYLPTLAIFSQDDFFSNLLRKYFESKSFDVRVNPKKTLGVDYFVLNISDTPMLDNYGQFLRTLSGKCVVVIPNKLKQYANDILKLNGNLSVGITVNKTNKVFDYSSNIAKELLSFGHSGKSFLIKGKEIKSVPLKVFKNKKLVKIKPVHQGLKIKRLKLNKKFVKYITLSLVALISLFLVPAISLFLSATSLYFSAINFTTKQKLSNTLLSIASSSASFAKSVSYGLPLYVNAADILSQSVVVMQSGVRVVESSIDLVTNITGRNIYDLEKLSTNLSAELDSLYINLGFLEGSFEDMNTFPSSLIKNKLQKTNINLSAMAKDIYASKEIASNLSSLLGGNTPKKYLILFQNNMELRPTGGFIGSFALVTLDGGRLSDITVSDVYSADGQLKGHVDPPVPIRDVLGEGGWYMRDANWDPDFPTSASKIEWFLDKEINSQVDGVVAIDLHLVQKLLEVIGPITLNDFSQTVTSENLYSITQSEVENDFFPGSTKKASFLTSLSRQLITELQNLDIDKKPLSLVKIYQSLEEGHIQLFIHETNIQKTLNNLGYDGSVDVTTNCGLRCIWDKYYLIEANLGVNKANYYISRSHDLYLTVNKQDILHELLITYTNSGKKILGNSAVYKTYTRLVIPPDSVIRSIKLYSEGGLYQDLDYVVEDISGRREVGFLMQVMPESSTRLQISWNLPQDSLVSGGEYRLKVNKQAGTDMDPFSLTLKPSSLNYVTSIPKLTLTQQGVNLYNTNLRQNFELKVFVK